MRSDRRHKTEAYKARKLANLKHMMAYHSKSPRNVNRTLKTPAHYIYMCDCTRCSGTMTDKASRQDEKKLQKLFEYSQELGLEE